MKKSKNEVNPGNSMKHKHLSATPGEKQQCPIRISLVKVKEYAVTFPATKSSSDKQIDKHRSS